MGLPTATELAVSLCSKAQTLRLDMDVSITSQSTRMPTTPKSSIGQSMCYHVKRDTILVDMADRVQMPLPKAKKIIPAVVATWN